jgi:hypothetical protein
LQIGDIKTQEHAIEALEGWASDRRVEMSEGATTRRPLVKSYMLEYSERRGARSLANVFEKSGVILQPLDGEFHRLWDSKLGKYVGFLEVLIDRHPVVYTTDKVSETDRWVRRLTRANPALDRLWLSGITFKRLWEAVLRQSPPHRFGKVVFQHQNIFEPAPGQRELFDDSFENTPRYVEDRLERGLVEDDDYADVERKTTRFAVVDRLSELRDILPGMQKLYAPLHSIAQLRFPGANVGGHDFYFDGKVTNRTDSFREHRLRVKYVLQVYRGATERTEEATWSGAQPMTVNGAAAWFMGAPVRLKFSKPLDSLVFQRFVSLVFDKEQSDFNLWGQPIWLGPTKVHVYALDRHVAQKLFIEITSADILLVLPQGTCGNTVHRFITNVQQLLDPAVTASIGDKSYASLIETEIDDDGRSIERTDHK